MAILRMYRSCTKLSGQGLPKVLAVAVSQESDITALGHLGLGLCVLNLSP